MSFLCSLNICGFGTSENASRQYFVTDSETEDSPKRKLVNLSQVKKASYVCPIHEGKLWGVVGAQLGTISIDLAEFSCHERTIPLKVCTLFRLSELFLLGSVGHGWLVGDMALECSQLTAGTLLSQLALPALPCVRKHYPYTSLHMAPELGWSRGRHWLCKVTVSLLSDHLFIVGYSLSGDYLHP